MQDLGLEEVGALNVLGCDWQNCDPCTIMSFPLVAIETNIENYRKNSFNFELV